MHIMCVPVVCLHALFSFLFQARSHFKTLEVEFCCGQWATVNIMYNLVPENDVWAGMIQTTGRQLWKQQLRLPLTRFGEG